MMSSAAIESTVMPISVKAAVVMTYARITESPNIPDHNPPSLPDILSRLFRPRLKKAPMQITATIKTRRISMSCRR
jgi:hypothetical protein